MLNQLLHFLTWDCLPFLEYLFYSTRNGSGEMARVACTLRGKRLDGGVVVLSVGVNPVWS
jgi:hypothetical protein